MGAACAVGRPATGSAEAAYFTGRVHPRACWRWGYGLQRYRQLRSCGSDVNLRQTGHLVKQATLCMKRMDQQPSGLGRWGGVHLPCGRL